MSSSRSLFAVGLLIPILGATIPAEAAKNSSAARAECFRKANEVVASQGFSAMGQDAYRQCCFKAGIRP